MPEFDLYQWERIVLAARLGASTKLVAFTMRTHADPDGTRVRPGIARLAVLTELSYATVKRARQALVRAGLIELHRRGNRRARKADEYRLIIAEDVLDRIEHMSPSEIDTAAEAITDARAEAEAARRAKKDQGSDDDPDNSVQGSPVTPENRDQGSENDPEPADQGSPVSRDDAIRAHGEQLLGLTSDPPPDQVTTPQERPTANHLPAQPPTARDKCDHGIRIGQREDGSVSCALCRREARQQSIVEAS